MNVLVVTNLGGVHLDGESELGQVSFQEHARWQPTVATWGVIRWRASSRPGEVEVVTRSGNTATPDETWSPWSKAYTVANGERITRPNARYLQWRAVLKSGLASPNPAGDYACASFNAGNTELCSEPSPTAGTWYVLLELWDPYAGVTLTATVTP